MKPASKIRLIDVGIKALVTMMVTVWLLLIYQFAVSGLPMIRQLLGCMFSTMIIFGILSFMVTRLKAYRTQLAELSGEDSGQT